MPAEQEWFTVKEAAAYLRVSVRTVYKLVSDGRLPAYRLGAERHMRFRRGDLDDVMRPINPPGTPEPGEESDRRAA